nr:alpha/beta hydrolase family protein [uncultured Draconibacterium sp.]
MKKFMLLILVVTSFCIVLSAGAAEVKKATTYSQTMDKEIGVVVITPEGYTALEHYPVLYLLHGYSGNQKDWITKVPQIKDYADLYQFIIVCPDGGYSSWYFDSPVDNNWKYETYIADELINWVDKKYSTRGSREGRAITGLSMGGHGALYLAFRHQDVYGAAGSMSGGVDIRPFPKNWGLSERLGAYADNPENWEKNTVINLVYKLEPNALKITFDCGTEDFFYGVNCKLHEKLAERNIPHDFTARPGGHTWEYWANSIAFQSVFFHHFFEKAKQE